MGECEPARLTLGVKSFPSNRRWHMPIEPSYRCSPLITPCLPGYWPLVPGILHGTMHTVGAQWKPLQERMEKGNETQMGIPMIPPCHTHRSHHCHSIDQNLSMVPYDPRVLGLSGPLRCDTWGWLWSHLPWVTCKALKVSYSDSFLPLHVLFPQLEVAPSSFSSWSLFTN